MRDASLPVQVIAGAFPNLGVDFVVQEAANSSREDAVRLALEVLPGAATEVMIVSGSLPLLTPQMLDQAALEGSRDRAAGVLDFAAACQADSEHATCEGLQWAAVAMLREAFSKNGGLSCMVLLHQDNTFDQGQGQGQPLVCHADGREVLTAASNGLVERITIMSLDSRPAAQEADLTELDPIISRQGLADAETALRRHLIRKHQAKGVTFRDPANTWVGADVSIGRDSVIGIGVQLCGNTSIGRWALQHSACAVSSMRE